MATKSALTVTLGTTAAALAAAPALTAGRVNSVIRLHTSASPVPQAQYPVRLHRLVKIAMSENLPKMASKILFRMIAPEMDILLVIGVILLCRARQPTSKFKIMAITPAFVTRISMMPSMKFLMEMVGRATGAI